MIKELTKEEALEKYFTEKVKNFEILLEDCETVAYFCGYNDYGFEYFRYKGNTDECRIYGTTSKIYINIPDEYEPYPDDVCPDLKCGDVIISKKGYHTELMVTMVTREGNEKHIHLFDWKDNKFLFDNYTYKDGSPIGRVKGSE